MRGQSRTPPYALLTAFVACVWLNQSVGGRDWERLRDEVFPTATSTSTFAESPAAHWLATARYPFVFLYRRSLDERYYYETAAAVVGMPADDAIVRQMHGKMPDDFRQTLPPADGRWHAPYTEVPMEYPPLNLPFFVGPRLLSTSFAGFGYRFGALMGLCLLGGIAAAVKAAREGDLGDGEDQTDRKWLLASGLLLAQGSLAIQRLDAIAALWLGLAMLAAARRMPLVLGLTMGLAADAKILPLLALPVIALADGAFYRDRTKLRRLASGLALALALGFGPLLLSPRAALSMLRYHAQRGLNVEATLGIVLGIGRALLGRAESAPASFGSQNLVGRDADLLARLSAPLMLACVGLVVWRLARPARHSRSSSSSIPSDDGAPNIGRIAAAALATITTLWLTSKVLSPQYLTWCIPVVLAVPGPGGARLAWVAVLAMALTQLYTRGYYDLVVAQAPIALVTLAVRQAVLVVLLWLAIREADRAGGSSPAHAA